MLSTTDATTSNIKESFKAKSILNTVLIRQATINDIPFIFQSIKALASHQGLLNESVSTIESLTQSLFPSTHSPYAQALIASKDTQDIGMCIYFSNFSTWTGKPGIYMEDLWVDESARGMGVGRLLMSHLKTLAEGVGMSGRVDWMSQDNNTVGNKFYDGMGGRRIIGWSAWKLDKDL